MIFSIKPGGTLPESRARSARRAHATAVSVEALEGRTLLSHGGNRPPVLVTTGLQTPMVFRGPDPGPIHNVVGHGFAIKVPRFYAWYHGQKRAELNGASALALTTPDQSTLFLSGQVAGQLPTKTSGPGVNDFYVFGINRGRATGPGPFPGRPRVVADAAVVVAITSTGVTGYVKDLTSPTPAVALPASSITIKADTLHLAVPTSLLPSTGAAGPGRYQVNFWTSDAVPSTDFTHVASFVPEFRDFPVATVPRIPPNF